MANAIAGDPPEAGLDALLSKVFRESGHDFRDYRRGTVVRRLARRLHANGVRSYPEYLRILDAHPDEYGKLADDLAIKVSSFFRYPYSFQQVTRIVLPELLSRAVSRQVRFWSAACACGEEPYSLAILLAEYLGARQADFPFSIYASDISKGALAEAREGVYSPEAVRVLSPALLQRYFVPHHSGYQIAEGIQRQVNVFRFDLTATAIPPFTDLDCIFCCNVLIYFQRQLQERVLNMLCDSLATPGYLVLGEVETPTPGLANKLECVDSKARIYRKK